MSRKRVRRAFVVVATLVLVGTAVVVAGLTRDSGTTAQPSYGETAPALAKRLASLQKFSNAATARFVTDTPGGWADQDWYERSVDGNGDGPPTFEHFATARNDWHGLLGRPASGTGKWVPYGPTNGINDLTNDFRDRSVYNAGTEKFGGRTVHGVISPACKPAPEECVMWVATSNGGVWMTENALAEDNPDTGAYEGPTWEYMSETF